MKKVLSLFFFLYYSVAAMAHGLNVDPLTAENDRLSEKGNGKIVGTVLDSANQKPVEFATVALYRAGSDQPFEGAVCDDKGKFTISKIDEGDYKIVVSFIGYKSKTISVTISEKRDQVDLGTITLSSEAEVLKEVIVEGEKALIEERVDRTIYNAENDVTTKGGDATDVLKRVPMLTVDMDGNVSLRGNSNIQVLINNKPSTIVASSISDALKQIPADEIKSVEVITSPSARYDAEGSAGIINIITKKNTLQGLTLNINSGVGYRGSNLGLNGNYRRKKMGFSLGGFGRANYNINGAFENQQLTTQSDNQMLNIQRADTRNRGLFGNYNLGWDYDINEKNFLTASARFGIRNHTNFQDNFFTETSTGGVIRSNTLRNVETNDQSNNVDFNFTYTHLYQKPQREFSLQALYSRNNRDNNFENILLSAFNSNGPYIGPDRIKNLNDSYNQEITLQADYQTPVSTNQMFEVGAKEIIRKAVSNFTYYEASEGGAYEIVQNKNLSNNLNYDQNVTSGYLSYTYAAKSGYSFKAGSRYEYTTITAYSQTEEDIKIPSYGVLVPSINASKKIKNNNTLKVSYNRRIQRPSIRFLNPNVQSSNQLNVTIGNPELQPEFTNNYEISYSTLIKGTSLNITAFARNTNDAIQSVRDVINKVPDDPDTIRTTYQNIGLENAYGASVFASVNIGKLMLNGGGDVYYATLDNNSPNELYRASNEGWVVSGRLFGNYNLGKNWQIQGFGFFRGRQVQLQGAQGGFRMYSLGLQKQFNEKRGSVGLSAENFIGTSLKIRNETTSPVIDQKSIVTLNNFGVRANFSYRIGKMSMDNRPRRRRSINNDDLKEGGGNDMGMNEGGGAQQNNGGGNVPSMQRGAPASAAPAKPTPAADLSAEVVAEGTWNYTVESPQGGEGTLTIKKEGDKYSGTINNKRFNRDIPLSTVSVKGNELSFAYELSFGPNQMNVNVIGIIKDDSFEGNMTIGQFGTFPIKAKRAE